MQKTKIPYGRQSIGDEDVAAVVEALRSDWLTTGPRVEEFEEAFADFVGARHAVAVNSGTAALHAAMFAAGVGPGDEAIVPAMTFVASANCVVFQGATPVFADVDRDTLLLDVSSAASRITSRTKAIVAVDYAGQPCDYDSLRALADARGLKLIADGCHALGGRYHDRPVGSLADLTAFSFHPVKHITTGEGGMVTTDSPELALRMRGFRNHGLNNDSRQREKEGSWYYEMVELGFNYRLTDFQCALGMSQLRQLPGWIRRRQEIARCYDAALAAEAGIRPLQTASGVTHAYHLYVVRLDGDRSGMFRALRADGIGVNVHYIPVHLHPFYRTRFGTGPGLCPVAERAYEEILSLPMFPQMTDGDLERVITALFAVRGHTQVAT
ncbi:MAG: UDP-4-amino-4,6-dideoxy-N-acetyl-beta-L-altrosamine transaminase [Acidobacteriota bacterium]